MELKAGEPGESKEILSTAVPIEGSRLGMMLDRIVFQVGSQTRKTIGHSFTGLGTASWARLHGLAEPVQSFIAS